MAMTIQVQTAALGSPCERGAGICTLLFVAVQNCDLGAAYSAFYLSGIQERQDRADTKAFGNGPDPLTFVP
jgi:hypothetical protein